MDIGRNALKDHTIVILKVHRTLGAIPEGPHNSYSKGPLDIGKSVEISMVLFNVLDWLLKYTYLLEQMIRQTGNYWYIDENDNSLEKYHLVC